MTDRTATRLAWSLAAGALIVVAGTATLVVLNREFIHTTTDMNLIEIILPVGFAVVGGVVASRRPQPDRLAVPDHRGRRSVAGGGPAVRSS